jgi:hypothetical protein
MLQMLQWLYMHVSSACFKCFICFQTYVANVLSGCFKSISGVAHVFNSGVGHVTMAPMAGVTMAFLARRASPSSPYPSFPPSPYHDSSSSAGKPYPTRAQAPVEVVTLGRPDGSAMPVW